MAHLMLLAFLIDQIQQRCCALFELARTKAVRNRYFWERLRSKVFEYRLRSWETLYQSLAYGHRAVEPEPALPP